ncbi:glutaredoxin-C6-like [Mangifera indica]|uniref:glutaredoxin-C6-like n=1 Tax=Mangifera indica TaxID=29780 RepID=UPI001CF95281|nr:glutaredoxin-C6-like [Mangifera indica]
MQGLRRYQNDIVQLDLNPTSSSPSSSSTMTGAPTNLSIDGEESTETKIQRLISEHPVIIFSRSSCCMCHVMRKLLATIGVHPTVIELEDHEISALPPTASNDSHDSPRNPAPPAVFIGGTYVGGLDSLFALHLSGHLVPKLVEVGALWV